VSWKVTVAVAAAVDARNLRQQYLSNPVAALPAVTEIVGFDLGSPQ